VFYFKTNKHAGHHNERLKKRFVEVSKHPKSLVLYVPLLRCVVNCIIVHRNKTGSTDYLGVPDNYDKRDGTWVWNILSYYSGKCIGAKVK
jgi:hypothetical protein